MITSEQVKAARSVVGLSVRGLAAAADMSPFTITRFETGKGGMYAVNMAKVQAVLERAGITFLPDHGEGPGIRWRQPET
jgi:predicted transcriptional regulator